MEERQQIARTLPLVLQSLNGAGLHELGPMRSVLLQAVELLGQAKTYYEACELADVRYLDASSANLEKYIRSQEVAPMLCNVLDPTEETDF